MTRRPSRPAAWAAALLLVALVAAVHLLVLRWLGGAMQAAGDAPLAPPVYTELLKPAAPPPAAPPLRTPPPAPRPAPARAAPAAVAPVAVASAAAALPASTPSAPAAPASNAVAAGGSAPDLPAAAPTPPASTTAAASAPSAAASAAEPAPVAGDGWPPSTRLSYTISGNWRGRLHGSGALVWTVDGDRYEATLSGSALISFAYRSTGRIDGGWLAPQLYTERVFTREKSVRFDRADGTVHFSASPQVVPLQPHVQDSASLFLQIAHRLTTQPAAFHPGATLTFAVARPSGMTDWSFTVEGTDTVTTGAGTLACWHLVRRSTQPNEIGAQIWLAPQLQNLPVQILLQQSADSDLLFTLDRAEQAAGASPR